MNETQSVVTRFAPSPTGLFHVGSARTALFNYLFAKNHGGSFLLRIEDTDKERSEPKFEEEILNSLKWLGLQHDQAAVRQSERGAIYEKYISKLIESGAAYVSKEEEGDRDEVIRFKNPNTTISFQDVVRGEVTFETEDLGDFVIAKSMTEPLYHLAVVVDDHEMSVTHVIRGEDHISNTPRQILIQEAIGASRPVYAHIPLILGPDKSKLSKRHGATAVLEYKEKGYLPDAFDNYLALLGWSPGDDREVFELEELVEAFSLKNVQKGGAIFNIEKLNWINRQHILQMSDHDMKHVVEEVMPADIKKLPHYNPEMLGRVLSVIRERIETFGDVEEMANNGDLEYFFEQPGYFAEGLLWRDDEDITIAQTHLEKAKELFSDIPEDSFDADMVKGTIWEYASQKGRGSVLWPLRYALSGVDHSPGPFVLAEVLGKEETLKRIDVALERIHEDKGGDIRYQ